MGLNEYISIGTIVSVVAFFLKDLFYGHRKNTESIGDLKAAAASLAKLGTSMDALKATVHGMELTLATMAASFVTKSDHHESIARLHKRIDEMNLMMLTGERKAVKP